MGPWWVNLSAGLLCTLLAVNFYAQAYGLRLGGKPLDTTTIPRGELMPQNGMWPPMPLGKP